MEPCFPGNIHIYIIYSILRFWKFRGATLESRTCGLTDKQSNYYILPTSRVGYNKVQEGKSLKYIIKTKLRNNTHFYDRHMFKGVGAVDSVY